jgi:hypothetical protein
MEAAMKTLLTPVLKWHASRVVSGKRFVNTSKLGSKARKQYRKRDLIY